MKTIANIFILIALISVSSCSKSLTPAQIYAKEHSYNSFEGAMSRNESFKLHSVREDLKSAKTASKMAQKKAKDQEKIQRIIDMTNDVRNGN